MRLRRFFARDRWDEERARELESYLAIETDDNVARGMTLGDARAAALRKLGNRTRVREDIYNMNTWGFFDGLWRDVRFGIRLLRLNPGFAAIAILSLALGIGANTAIFQLLDAVRLRTIPVSNPQELVNVTIARSPGGRTGDFNGRYSNLTNPLWEGIRDRQRAFSTVLAWGTATFELASGGESRPAAGLWVSGDFFAGLGVGPLIGRVLMAADDHRGCGNPGAVLSYAFWQREYGGDPSVIGRTISLSGYPTDIVGVTPASFYGVEVGRVFDVAVPICAEPILEPERNTLDKRDSWWLAVVGRLNPGWSVTQATAQLAAISPALFAETLPPTYPADIAQQYKAFALTARLAGTGFSHLRLDYETPLWMLLAIAFLVLLIACGNLASLMLARASAREREIAVRLAIGASRARLIRQLLVESAIIAAAGGAIGVAMASELERVLLSFFASTWLFVDLHADWRVLVFTTGVAAVTCAVFGAMPAVRATAVDPGGAMKAASRGLSDSRARFGMRRALVVAQVALSLVLVVGALLFVRTLWNLATLDAGFQRDGLLVADMDTRRLRMPSARQPVFERGLIDRVRGIPGIDAVAATYIVPVSGRGWNEQIVIDSVVRKEYCNFNRVSPGFFRTMGIALLKGRDFTDHDAADSESVAVVSESFVRTFMSDREALGRTFTIYTGPGEHSPLYHIVGLVKDTKYTNLREQFQPIAFLATAQDNHRDAFVTEETLVIRSRAGLTRLVPEVKRAIAETQTSILVEFQPLTTQIDRTLVRERLMAVLSGFFGGLAALLATIGLYGVIAYTVARRRNEIGIRIALGAERRDVLTMVLREAATLVAAGILVGGILAVAAARSADALLFGLHPGDPLTLLVASGGLALVAMTASYVPALRASRLAPTEALRDE